MELEAKPSLAINPIIPKYESVPILESYYPTRLEYFAGKALQGLVTSRSEKNIERAVTMAVKLAIDLEKAIDEVQDK